MYGLLILALFVGWLATAFGVFWLCKRYLHWSVGIPLALGVLAAPFWDYFFMVPAINEAYKRLAVSKVYKISDARTIRIIKIAREIEIPSTSGAIDPSRGRKLSSNRGFMYEDALREGQILHIDVLVDIWEPGKKGAVRLVRFTRHEATSSACQQQIYKISSTWCIRYQFIPESDAEISIEYGTVYATPYSSLPKKKYEYEFWIARNNLTKKTISEATYGFRWDPEICYFFNACRYVVDRNQRNIEYIQAAIPSLITRN